MSFPKSDLRSTVIYRVADDGFSDGDARTNLPDALMDALHWRASDSLLWKRHPTADRWTIKNQSVRVLFIARARRNLNSLAKALDNSLHPIERVLIKSRDSHRKPAVLIAASVAGFLYKDVRGTAAKIRTTLKSPVRPENQIKLGSLLAEIGREADGIDLEIERDQIAAGPMGIE